MKSLLLVATLFASSPALTLEFKPGAELTVTGQISSLQQDELFIMRAGEDRILVYASAAQLKNLQIGHTVEVQGVVPTDWVKLAKNELRAVAIRPR